MLDVGRCHSPVIGPLPPDPYRWTCRTPSRTLVVTSERTVRLPSIHTILMVTRVMTVFYAYAEGMSDPGPWFAAAYSGSCSGCGEDIEDGDEIRADGGGGWERRECCGEDEDAFPVIGSDVT